MEQKQVKEILGRQLELLAEVSEGKPDNLPELSVAMCEIEQELFNRLGKIEDILGDDYDLDRLRELVEADREGRCIVLPCKVGDELFYSDGEWIGKETVEKIVIDIETDGGIYAPRDIGYSVYKSAEEAEAVLKEDQHGQDL